MNKTQWESRLAGLQHERKNKYKQIDRLDTDIAECFTNIEGCRRREAIAMRKVPKAQRKKV